MDEPSRRALLCGLGVGTAGLLAGCNAPTSGLPEETEATTPSTPESTATPDPSPATPPFWEWLPRPDDLGGGYSFGSLAVPAVRSAGLARGRLDPTQFTPPQVQDVTTSTTDLLTVSTGSVAGGILRGDYDTGAFGEALESDGFSVDDDGIYTGDRLGFVLESDLVRWADHPSDPAAVLAVLGQHLDGDGDSYPGTVPAVDRALAAIRGASARFGRPLDVADGPFATAQFLANGMEASDGSIAWTSAIAFDGEVPESAADEYRQSFVDREGFENVVARTEPGLLVIESETSADRAVETRPL